MAATATSAALSGAPSVAASIVSSSSSTSPALGFKILAECSKSKARTSLMKLPHYTVELPMFMPVGTQVRYDCTIFIIQFYIHFSISPYLLHLLLYFVSDNLDTYSVANNCEIICMCEFTFITKMELVIDMNSFPVG